MNWKTGGLAAAVIISIVVFFCCWYPSVAGETIFTSDQQQPGYKSQDLPENNREIPDKGEKSREPEENKQKKYKTLPGKKVYLTFDDGPNKIITPLVLDILEKYGVKATFFVVGTNIEKNPEILKDIVRRGNAIGNHTYNHRYDQVYSSPHNFLNSFKKNEEIIFNLTGQKPAIIRPPGGNSRLTPVLKKVLKDNGYRSVGWNVDSYDSRKPYLSGRDIVEQVRRQAANKNLWPGMVIVMHDSSGHMSTVRALPTVIEYLLFQGFEFDIIR